ncbi:unnamed protein product [Leptidea sinapis]|uniref:Uncharacterized protein n=1 Tax=Leptidea sinapis TaxID=189913 RepID=A0A5E4R3X3_9NEOP|nr:unnamed protein product [Leptidea sinapis]
MSADKDKDHEDVEPESMEEAGAHSDLRPEMMFIREELRQAKWQTLAVRRIALKEILLRDFLREDCELRNVGLAYAPPDP